MPSGRLKGRVRTFGAILPLDGLDRRCGGEVFIVDNLLKTLILATGRSSRPGWNPVGKIGNLPRSFLPNLPDCLVFSVTAYKHRLYVLTQTRPRESFFNVRLWAGNSPTIGRVDDRKSANWIAGG